MTFDQWWAAQPTYEGKYRSDAEANARLAWEAAMLVASHTVELDAARWRKIAQVLSVSAKRRVEKVVEWKWNLDIHQDHSWKMYGCTNDEASVPKSLDEFIDRLVLE